MSFALSGCAYIYTDDRGATHVVGFASISIPRNDSKVAMGASAVKVRTVGVSVINTDIASSISVGYDSNELLVIRNNACVRLGPSFEKGPADSY